MSSRLFCPANSPNLEDIQFTSIKKREKKTNIYILEGRSNERDIFETY